MSIIYDILILILAMWFIYFITERINRKNTEEEIKKICDKHNDNLNRLENKLHISRTEYQSRNAKYEILLSNYNHLESKYREIANQKLKAEFRADKLQSELFRARKRSKKLLGVKQN